MEHNSWARLIAHVERQEESPVDILGGLRGFLAFILKSASSEQPWLEIPWL